MRDIPKVNYNVPIKNKKIPIENETNGVLTKCTFKSYKDFLENYESKNTKDDQESVSSTDSGISDIKSYSTSTSSLSSENGSSAKVDVFSSGRTGSFRNYLENYNHKKFNSVKPIATKQNVIKSEIVIQVNAPEEFVPDERDIPDYPPPPPLERPEEPAPVTPPPPPPPSIPPPPPPSIPPPPPPFITNQCIPKKWAPIETETQPASREKQVSNNSAAATNLAAILTQNALFKRKAHESEKVIECKPILIEKPPTPQPPRPIVNHNTLPRAKAPEFVNHRTITIEVPIKHSPPKLLDEVDYRTTTIVPIADRHTTVKTNDPNVKKMVYSTYRGLLGAYNNKANDMIATLPRTTMVKEDRGISKQLESIALQGGLEKLNGRTNPKVETDSGAN